MKKLILIVLLTHFAVSAFAQNTVSLDAGFSGGVKYFEGRIARGTRLVVLNFKSSSPQLSEYIMEELTAYFVNNGSFNMVDRSNLELLQQEMAFQLSGEVSDETALSIGKKLGAQTIISGSVEPFGDSFRLRIRAIAVESATIQGIYTANIQKDRILTSLSGTSNSGGNTPQNNNSQSSQGGNTVPSQSPQTGNSGSRVSLPDYLLSN
jgi:TolB-like protein